MTVLCPKGDLRNCISINKTIGENYECYTTISWPLNLIPFIRSRAFHWYYYQRRSLIIEFSKPSTYQLLLSSTIYRFCPFKKSTSYSENMLLKEKSQVFFYLMPNDACCSQLKKKKKKRKERKQKSVKRVLNQRQKAAFQTSKFPCLSVSISPALKLSLGMYVKHGEMFKNIWKSLLLKH